jgi:hypothetical protein
MGSLKFHCGCSSTPEKPEEEQFHANLTEHWCQIHRLTSGHTDPQNRGRWNLPYEQTAAHHPGGPTAARLAQPSNRVESLCHISDAERAANKAEHLITALGKHNERGVTSPEWVQRPQLTSWPVGKSEVPWCQGRRCLSAIPIHWKTRKEHRSYTYWKGKTKFSCLQITWLSV